MRSNTAVLIVLLVGGVVLQSANHVRAADGAIQGTYRMLPGEPGASPPFQSVSILRGPSSGSGSEKGVWWQLEVRQEDDARSQPLMAVRALTSGDLLADADRTAGFLRYQLRIPSIGETFEYVNAHTGRALLPVWAGFQGYFMPRPVMGTGRQKGMPNTCEYLGHTLTLRSVSEESSWKEWDGVKVLKLDPELLIGTSRSFKDKDGKRLPAGEDYPYVKFVESDYRTMVEAGINLFIAEPAQERFVRGEAVFYIRGPGGDPPLRYPADLYRSNYAGNEMFMDEPTCIMTGDKLVYNNLKFFTDAASLITQRVRSRYFRDAHAMETSLKGRGISFGAMDLAQLDFPSWETRYETAYYQLAGGLAGIVHEGRYQLGEFNEFAKASTGIDRKFTGEEMFKYYYAFLRGAARHFDKDWGTSIYGQADPKLSPLAVTLAYDMGARYLWYWTSDHDHHMPWPEQLELTRIIRKHAAEKPRSSIRAGRPTLDKAIAIPYGYFVVLESPTQRKNCWDLWWVREMDAEGKNEASQRYRRLVQKTMAEVIKSLDAGQQFDITVDDGREITGYKQVVRVGAE